MHTVTKPAVLLHSEYTPPLVPDGCTTTVENETKGIGMSDSDSNLRAELERLRAENENLKAGRTKGVISLKVSEKGAVSLYGLGRFPVTLYKEQWARLLDQADQIRQFIAENESKLKAKE